MSFVRKNKTVKPGGPPKPDYQGPYPTCSSHALSKAITSGYNKGIFTNGVPVNVNQESIAENLIDKFQSDFKEMCPSEFNQKSVHVWDEKKIAWNTKITVTIVEETPDKELTKQNLDSNEYLITYFHDDELHCIHVGNVSKVSTTLLTHYSFPIF